MHFDTNTYERSHGHTPRGRGGWMFQDAYWFEYDQRSNTYTWDTIHTFSGTYTEAKRAARASGKFHRAATVVVMP